jgi:hypothetical protein
MRARIARALLAAAIAVAAGCAHLAVRGLERVPATDPSYAIADPAGATGVPGEGKVTTPTVVRLTSDRAVYRLWAGPAVKDAQGRTSRIGQWWTFEAPKGTLASFRRRYEVCEKWDTLRFVAQCTLKRGAVVVIGPGQSVSAETCEKPDESYPVNTRDFQVYIHNAWRRPELSCPDEGRDYQDDPQDIARPAAR